jgi:hypothetical protein
MTKKTRANWTLPMMNTEIPSSTSMMVPHASAEEMHLLKDLNNGNETPMDGEKKRTFRMVNLFGKKPPIPFTSTLSKNQLSRNAA